MTDITYDQIAQFAYNLSSDDDARERMSLGERSLISMTAMDVIRLFREAHSMLESIQRDVASCLENMGKYKQGDKNQNMARFISKAHTDLALAEEKGDMLMLMLENAGYTAEDIAEASA